METKSPQLHIGRKISRIREIRGLKQEFLASELGVTQQAISKIEQSADVEDVVLNKIASILGVTADSIKNFSDEAIFNYFNTFHDNSGYGAFNYNHNNHCTFNPLDKLMQTVEENKNLYERLLASEREKIEILQRKG